MNKSEKQTVLEEITGEIKSFKGLEIARKCTLPVPGEGDPDSEIMFIGEAPGFHEDRQGRPFVGLAGKLLEKTLQEVLGLGRSQVFITNVVKFRPPDNRDPFPDEIEACRDWLDRQISAINPKIIVTLGRFSMAKFIPDITISRIHGQPRFFDFSHDSTCSRFIIFPMYHPAAALRSTSVLNLFKEDFFKLKSLLAKKDQVPEKENKLPPVQPALFN